MKCPVGDALSFNKTFLPSEERRMGHPTRYLRQAFIPLFNGGFSFMGKTPEGRVLTGR
jgi:hypothetical protein